MRRNTLVFGGDVADVVNAGFKLCLSLPELGKRGREMSEFL